MSEPLAESLQRLNEQYDELPYPNIPIEQTVDHDLNDLFIHSLITPYYRRYGQVVFTEGKVILDAGCGSGYSSLVLAVANPGAKIVGIDLSQRSVDVARQRLQHHGFDQAEFHVLGIDDIPQLNQTFDYINCDEVLYILPQPLQALKILRTVLKPQGILRGNVHSFYQRIEYFRAQSMFKILGLFQNNPGDQEVAWAVDTMKTMKDQVIIKKETWQSKYEDRKQRVLMNYLLQGDKGFTIPQLFALLRQADLAFLSMVKWRQWDFTTLFQGDADKLPPPWQKVLAQSPMEEKLHLFELMHPIHRLLDFWCMQPGGPSPRPSLKQWGLEDWQQARVQLHPQLQSPKIKQAIVRCIRHQEAFEISRYISVVRATPCVIKPNSAACLLPLWEGPQTFTELVQRWQMLGPVDPVTLAEINEQAAAKTVARLVHWLETHLYVLVDQPVQT